MSYIDNDKKEQKAFFNWFKPVKPTGYTDEDLESLIKEIKTFNAGVIDEYLDNHVDKVFTEWKIKVGEK